MGFPDEKRTMNSTIQVDEAKIKNCSIRRLRGIRKVMNLAASNSFKVWGPDMSVD